LTTRLEKTILSEKMIEQDLSRVEECATKSTYRLGVRRVLLSSFPAPSTTKKNQQSNAPKLTTHLTQSHHSTQREKQRKKLPSIERKLLFVCFVPVLVT
jgi:hypothetical protein